MAAEWLLLPAVQALVGKVTDALVQWATSMWGVEDDRSKLESQLVYVRSLLADAELKAEAQTDAGRAVKAWMKKLKAVAYQADDVLDTFRYEALRREIEGGEDTPRKVPFMSRDPSVFHPRKAMARHNATSDLKAVLGKIDSLLVDMKRFGLMERAEVPQLAYRQTHSALDESSDIFGRDDDKELVVKMLLDKQDHNNVQVLPIVGMGGLGKTTLAKMVYNDHRVQNHFELKMWYCVSENFEATTIIRSVIELATNGRCDLSDNIELLRGQLQEGIGGKRYLLILDDVWNEDLQKWEDYLKPLLCSSIGGLGSMIVVTSRSQKVASIMGTLPPHELRGLSDLDSWNLFSKKAFSKGVEMQAEFVTIGKRIVSKCKGLPLALKTMGGLMSSIRQVQQWENIAESNIGDSVTGKDEILPILKLSYGSLPPEMKRCFAFCAIFPKDYVMRKDELIELWIANGYIHEEGTMELLAQRAEFVFNELAWRSFFEVVKVLPVWEGGFDNYKIFGCKMHDLVHDLAKYVNDECTSTAELNQRKASIKDVRHMHVSRYGLEKISGLLKEASSLHTLLIEANHTDVKELGLESLRALWCRDPSIIHGQLINPTHLRYLDLSGSDLAKLPEKVCIMYNLMSLRLNNCRELRCLPDGMTSLRKLSYLYLLGCEKLERMPPKLSLLQNLCILTMFIVGTEDGCGIEELKGLRQLSNRLELYNLRNVKSGSKADLHEKRNLSELVLSWGHEYDRCYNSANDEARNAEEALESLAPHGGIKTLEVRGYGGLAIPQWMKDGEMFRCLKKLVMYNCARCKEFPAVWFSSALEELYVSRMDSLTTLCKEADNTPLQIFPKLNKMVLTNLPQLERWAENSAGETIRSVVFPLLKDLRIRNCGKLTSLPKCPPVHKLFYLENEVVSYVPSLISDDDYRSIFNLSKSQLGLGGCFPFLQELEFIGLSSIICWPMEELQYLPHLRFMTFTECSKLEGKGSSSSDGFLLLTRLEKLEIRYCDSLLEIPMLPASLEELRIDICTSLVALPSNLGSLARLRVLSVSHCDALRAMPDGMDGLTSLEESWIGHLPGIKEFPQGLLQRLTTLKNLNILDWPDMQRRCREGGEYFDLVSSIPWTYIPAPEAETE